MSIIERALGAARRTAEARNAKAGGPAPALDAASRGNAAESVAPRPRAPHSQIKLDLDRLRSAGALPPVDFERQLTEQYRKIKRPLVDYAFPEGQQGPVSRNLIVVTSSFPAEGKTFTSLNLAISLSMEKDATVLLVDADIANPRLSGLFGQQQSRGMFDALADESLDVESLVVDTSIPGLSFLSTGALRESSAELLASSRMSQMMMDLIANEPRRLIVLDSPPLLLTNESRELVSLAGQIVLVVHAGVTPQESVKEAVSLLPDGKNVGVVLNQVDPSSADVSYYGYGRYGAYSTDSGARNEA
ncbi:MAG: protein tyrosine kinase [Proteobacteria bacterium]|nr:protein tyrosine kinase [Pseudomonadota bacterium]